MCCEKVTFCVRCTPNSLAAPTLLTLVITDGKRSFGMLGLWKTSSTVFSRLTLILFSLGIHCLDQWFPHVQMLTSFLWPFSRSAAMARWLMKWTCTHWTGFNSPEPIWVTGGGSKSIQWKLLSYATKKSCLGTLVVTSKPLNKGINAIKLVCLVFSRWT